MIGSGISRSAAERDAIARLAATFGVDIQVDERLRESYRVVTRNGAASWVQYSEFDSEIRTAVAMNNLIGVEIIEVWNNGRGTNYALAVMNRARARQIYSELIRANHEAIENLLDMSPEESNTLAGFSRYQLAAVFADMNISYGAVLAVLGVPVQGLIRGENFRREAQEIRANIPIGINVTNDMDARIQDAFARTFADLGFRTGGTNHRYVLNVSVDINFEHRYSQHHDAWINWVYMTLRAELSDSITGTVLIPYSIHNLREGHVNQRQAEDWVFRNAVAAINREYRDLVSEYLSRLVPTR
ncbi:MAG: LPP20 family lipoprotein [Treponema sp.]|nr:LPP20 family lipoprotein [Treponema sp.]